MKIVFYLNVISPHQLPLAREVVRLVGVENFKYVYAEDFHADRKAMGWDDGHVPTWCMKEDENSSGLIEADLIYTGLRCLDLMVKRSSLGKKTVYYSERWFKPMVGILRLLSPSYRRMAREFVRLMDEGRVVYFPCGIHAARDMARLCGLMHGDLRCLLVAPELEFEERLGGNIWLKDEPRNTQNTRKYCLDKMRMWGYFVERGKQGSGNRERNRNEFFRVLWVGRELDWKRVDTIIRAVGELSTHSTWLKISLEIYGTGPEERRLRQLASKYGEVVKFHPPVQIDRVRKLMREHDVYVLASNGYEGWGAVVSEALEEGMCVLGTYEAGSSATVLPEPCLFHAGDWRTLADLLGKVARRELPSLGIGPWTARQAARELVDAPYFF